MLDLSLSTQPSAGGMEYNKLAQSHVLTGLEPHGIRKMMEQGFDVNNGTMQDARAVLLSASLDANSEEDDMKLVSIDASWPKGLPAPIMKVLATEAAGAGSLNEAILALVSRRFSNLLLMPLDKVDTKKPLAAYGMDSMIAAEYRSWFWSIFKVDIQFLDILSSINHLETLAGAVEKELQEKME